MIPLEYLNELYEKTKEKLIGICLNKKILEFFDEGTNSTMMKKLEKVKRMKNKVKKLQRKNKRKMNTIYYN